MPTLEWNRDHDGGFYIPCYSNAAKYGMYIISIDLSIYRIRPFVQPEDRFRPTIVMFVEIMFYKQIEPDIKLDVEPLQSMSLFNDPAQSLIKIEKQNKFFSEYFQVLRQIS
uniref:Uncharacterized protein n=1 Tax=Glossina austeni TaxID=7395 RepID=A0A1A9UZY8_GLOAU